MKRPWLDRRTAHGRFDVLDYVLFLPCIWTASALGFSISIMGPLFLIIPVFCIFYALLRRTLPPRLLAIYVALCALAGVASYYRLFPASWQTAFLDEAIARQLVPTFSFFAVAWASKAYFRRRLRLHDPFAGELIILFLCFGVAPIIMLVGNIHYQEDSTELTVLAAYGTFINNIIIGIFFVMGRLFCGRGGGRLAAGGAVLAIAATTHFVQFWLATAAAFAARLRAPARLTALAMVVLLVSAYGYLLTRIPQEMAANPNKGIRVAFVADAFTSLRDTDGLGIGYGTESVRWTYRFPGMATFTFMPNPQAISRDRLLEVLSRGVHNSFVQAMLRTGVPGAVLLLLAIFAAFPRRNLPKPVAAHASILFAIIFISCFVNAALESPIELVGIAFVYGYLLALRSCTAALPSPPRHDLSQAAPATN